LGAEIISFTDPLDAMNYIRNHSNEIDVIFLDLNMPVYNGWKFLEMVEEYLLMPVYMLTSSINDQDLARSGEYGAIKQFISKPLTVEFVKELKAELEQ
jgi:CheY-like chemotaxis protein